jgi:glycosyltransferase involved in cell wall biosynthesis
MLRIVHVTGFISSKYGAFEKIMVSLARECAKRGHRFYCLMEAAPYSPLFSRDLEDAGAEIVVLPARGRRMMFTLDLALWLHRRGIHVVHTHFTPASTLALLAGRLAGVPLLINHIHSGLGERPEQVRLRILTLCRARRSLASQVLASSKQTRLEFRQAEGGGRDAHVHYLGVGGMERTSQRQETRDRLGLTAADQVLACVAFHAPVKGVDVLVDALGLLRADFPRLKLIQVGAPENLSDTYRTDELKQRASRAGVADRILWLGLRNDVPDLLGCADIYCLPSRSEGLPLAVLEAMEAGLPVVGSAVGGVAEAVEHGRTGLLVPSESPQALAQAVASLLRDPARRIRMGEEGRRVVHEHFSVDRQSRTLVDLYETLWRRVSLS